VIEIYSNQYRKPCVDLTDTERLPTFEDFTTFAQEIGAIYEEEPGELLYVVKFMGRPQELYTREAVERTLKRAADRLNR